MALPPEQKAELYGLLLKAHDEAARQPEDMGTHIVLETYVCTGSIPAALAAGVAAQGGMHCPIDAARKLLKEIDEPWVLLCSNKKLPGYGHTYFNGKDGKPDTEPFFKEVAEYISIVAPSLYNLVYDIRSLSEKIPQPNGAMWTAVALELLEKPTGSGAVVYAAMRINGWAALLLRSSEIHPEDERQPTQQLAVEDVS